MGEKGFFKRILENPKTESLIQFVKFGLVGVSNTLISYGIEMLFYYVIFKNAVFPVIFGLSPETVKVGIISIIAFVISVTNSYLWNNRYVFKTNSKGLKLHLLAYAKTFLCYASTGLLLSPVLKVLFTNWGLPFAIASLLVYFITIPLNFIMNKFWAFKKKS